MVYRCPYFLWDTRLIYGSGRVLYVYDLRECKLANRVEVDENIFSIWVDQLKGLIFLGCDNKTYMIYDSSFKLMATRKFGKKISFVTKFEDQLIVGDHFGDVSIVDYTEVAGYSTDNRDIDVGIGTSTASKDSQSGSSAPDKSSAGNKSGNDSDASGSAERLLVPYSHYSTITASLIRGSSLFTGDKDGKIVLNSMVNLHEIKFIFLAHKMSISCMDTVEDRLLVSLSIDGTVRLWCLSTATELLCLGLPESALAPSGTSAVSTDVAVASSTITAMPTASESKATPRIDEPAYSADSSQNANLRYNLACSYRNRLIVVPYLHLLLVILFDFDQLQMLGHSVIQLPFSTQLCLFASDTLLLVDEWSSLHSLDCVKIASSVSNTSTTVAKTAATTIKTSAATKSATLSTDSSTTPVTTPSTGSVPIFSTNRRLDLLPLAACMQLQPALLHDDSMRNRGAKINLTKHVYV